MEAGSAVSALPLCAPECPTFTEYVAATAPDGAWSQPPSLDSYSAWRCTSSLDGATYDLAVSDTVTGGDYSVAWGAAFDAQGMLVTYFQSTFSGGFGGGTFCCDDHQSSYEVWGSQAVLPLVCEPGEIWSPSDFGLADTGA
jgi:hypothetical protein